MVGHGQAALCRTAIDSERAYHDMTFVIAKNLFESVRAGQ